ncbi:MAG: serine acetyltransferase [Archangiaceae bacterium]|nr:serine acetyltransferase [Archangiaceae bacterium]
MLTGLNRFLKAVRADYGSVQRYRGKYHKEQISVARLPVDAFRKIGFQMMLATRFMGLARDLKVPLGPQVVSRMIRIVYGAEIHWNTEIAPGISIMHGNGLVLSHRARVGPGCILAHNVTLGEALDPVTKESGAPTLGRDVHVGPGATLLGPIHVGDGTKILAGAVLTRSVPPNSLVKPADSEVEQRAAARPKIVGGE